MTLDTLTIKKKVLKWNICRLVYQHHLEKEYIKIYKQMKMKTVSPVFPSEVITAPDTTNQT